MALGIILRRYVTSYVLRCKLLDLSLMVSVLILLKLVLVGIEISTGKYIRFYYRFYQKFW